MDCFCVRHNPEEVKEMDLVDVYTSQKSKASDGDPFQDDDFTDFFNSNILSSRSDEGDYHFSLVEHKVLDVSTQDIALSIVNTDGQLKGGGDANPPTTEHHEVGSQDDVVRITEKTRKYTSVENFDLKVPGLRHKQIEQLTRLKSLYLRKLSFYVDEDSFLMMNWEVAAMRNNGVMVDKISTLKSREKVNIITLTIHTDWLRAALEYIRDLKISVGTHTDSVSEESQHGIDLTGIYALEDLTGSGPRLVKNIVLSVFSNSAVERAEHKLDLVLQRNAHKHFSADKICQTMLRICRAANLNSDEFHGYMRHLRDPHLPSCPCGMKGSTQEAWTIHGCRYEAWVIRLGIAETIGGYLRFSPFSWDTIIAIAANSLADTI